MHIFTSKKTHLKVPSVKRRPVCLGFNVLSGITKCLFPDVKQCAWNHKIARFYKCVNETDVIRRFAVGIIEETNRMEMVFYIRLLFQIIGFRGWWSVQFKWPQLVMGYATQYIILHTSPSVITAMQHSNFHWITFISTCELYLQTICDIGRKKGNLIRGFSYVMLNQPCRHK